MAGRRVRVDYPAKHRGCMSELVACAWLLREGYEVFRNVSQHGDIDLVATKSGKVSSFDVKTATRKPDGTLVGMKLSAEQIEKGIKPLYVVLEDGTCTIDWEPFPTLWKNFDRKCAHCQKPFRPKANKQRFCEHACGGANYRQAQEVAPG